MALNCGHASVGEKISCFDILFFVCHLGQNLGLAGLSEKHEINFLPCIKLKVRVQCNHFTT